MYSSAIFSPCLTYRYRLTRIWDESLTTVVFILYNPSTADADKNDPTLRRCVGFAKDWGFGGLVLVNLFAFRSKQPKDLQKALNPIGPDNESYLKAELPAHAEVVCAWGLQGGPIPPWIIANSKRVVHLGLCKDGSPKHPLYLPATTKRTAI